MRLRFSAATLVTWVGGYDRLAMLEDKRMHQPQVACGLNVVLAKETAVLFTRCRVKFIRPRQALNELRIENSILKLMNPN